MVARRCSIENGYSHTASICIHNTLKEIKDEKCSARKGMECNPLIRAGRLPDMPRETWVGRQALLTPYEILFKNKINFLLLTDLDAVFNGLHWSLYVKLQVQTTELIFIEKNHANEATNFNDISAPTNTTTYLKKSVFYEKRI